MEGSGCQPRNYCWCFSTYNKPCIGDFRRNASINGRRVPQPAARNAVRLNSAPTHHRVSTLFCHWHGMLE
ncbi:hypothetical protein [Lapidilactobacillus wuchangensis]|uniref:hypothetical protein n=1 Tax=Lapidilactobacillus wuchangensis TaxID=2486001 RepID=UPI0013DE714C|nr:hypothetical protein [Lapidilactobacillus wuchangensis]